MAEESELAKQVESKENWRYVLLNGKHKQLAVLNPEFDKGELVKIDGLNPFHRKDDNEQPVMPTIDDVNHLKRNVYSEFFKKPFKNLLILSGAGSSMDVGGLSMGQLWTKVEKHYQNGGIDGFKIIREKVNFSCDKQDLEALLSQIDGYSKFSNEKEIKIGTKKHSLGAIRDVIFDIIKTSCTIPKPNGNYAHKIFLEKLLQRKQTNPRIKIYTLNYDLLFENAATDVNAIISDGFSYRVFLCSSIKKKFYNLNIKSNMQKLHIANSDKLITPETVAMIRKRKLLHS